MHCGSISCVEIGLLLSACVSSWGGSVVAFLVAARLSSKPFVFHFLTRGISSCRDPTVCVIRQRTFPLVFFTGTESQVL